jgi:recombination protein RecA
MGEEFVKAKDKEERDKAFQAAVLQVEKQFGKGSIIRLGENSAVVDAEVIPSGSLSLDLAMGIGGVPRGRVLEIFGPESSGKTTLTLTMIAAAQRLGGTAVFIDAEHALQPSYAKKLGVDIDNLHVSQPDTGEEALEIADQLVRSGAVDMIVIDSVAALVPRAEIEGEMGDSHMGLQARLMSQALRKLSGSISKSRAIVIFINQIRMKIGVLFGNPETTPGGNALKFFSSIRLDIRKVASIKEKETVTGNRTRVRVVKNKVAAPFRAAEFDIMFDEGISRTGEIIDMGVEAGILQKSGTWISYQDERLGQGRENARQLLRENPALADRIEYQIREAMGLPLFGPPPGAAPKKGEKGEEKKIAAAPSDDGKGPKKSTARAKDAVV